MLFLPNDDKLAAASKQIVEDVVAQEGRCRITGWRDVPVDGSIVGRMAKRTQPRFVQVCKSGTVQQNCTFPVGMRRLCFGQRGCLYSAGPSLAWCRRV